MENQPKPLKTYQIQHGTMKNQSGTIKNNLELDRVVTGDTQEERLIFRDKQTLLHNIYIIIIVITKTPAKPRIILVIQIFLDLGQIMLS